MGHRGVSTGLSTGLRLTAILLVFLVKGLCAATVSLNLEGLSSSEPVTNQFPGLTFENAIALQAGLDLNELEFPPHSGSMVISDDGGAMMINFATPIISFSGHFTYLVPLTITAYDGAGNVLGAATSAYFSNLACLAGPPCSGDPASTPNELIEITLGPGIRSITIGGNVLGASFAADDIAFATAVPEPSSRALTATIFGLLMTLRLLKRERKCRPSLRRRSAAAIVFWAD